MTYALLKSILGHPLAGFDSVELLAKVLGTRQKVALLRSLTMLTIFDLLKIEFLEREDQRVVSEHVRLDI